MTDAERATEVASKRGQMFPLTSNYNHPQASQKRRGDLIILLRTMTIVGNTLQRGDSGGRFEPGPKVLEMPTAWKHGDYDALLEALRKLRKHGPRHYWNVDQRYISPERTNRYLVLRGTSYFEAVPRYAGGETHYYAGDPFDESCMEILAAKTEPRARVRGKQRATLVRAIVERWNPRVEKRPLNVGLDFLLFAMPAQIRLPREIRNAA